MHTMSRPADVLPAGCPLVSSSSSCINLMTYGRKQGLAGIGRAGTASFPHSCCHTESRSVADKTLPCSLAIRSSRLRLPSRTSSQRLERLDCSLSHLLRYFRLRSLRRVSAREQPFRLPPQSNFGRAYPRQEVQVAATEDTCSCVCACR